jgi:hypothetical protein
LFRVFLIYVNSFLQTPRKYISIVLIRYWIIPGIFNMHNKITVPKENNKIYLPQN